MKLVGMIFLRGLLALLPAVLTLYVIYHSLAWLNGFTNALLTRLWPAFPELPGLGIALGLLAIFAFGLLVSTRLTRQLVALLEAPLRRVPLVKTLYNALRALADYMGPSETRRANQVVAVRPPGTPVQLVGFIMREDLEGLPAPLAAADSVAVYLPMSYQIGGYTAFVPREWVQPLEIGVEAAMREALTGWIGTTPVKAPDDPGARGYSAPR